MGWSADHNDNAREFKHNGGYVVTPCKKPFMAISRFVYFAACDSNARCQKYRFLESGSQRDVVA